MTLNYLFYIARNNKKFSLNLYAFIDIIKETT